MRHDLRQKRSVAALARLKSSFSSRRRHTIWTGDWSSDLCSSDLVGALLGDQRDHLADLAVVDRVLDAVGDQRVRLADVEADVEHQPLADLALRGRDAVVRVEDRKSVA